MFWVFKTTVYVMLLTVFQDFEETMKIVELFKFPSLFINQFYPRPGTPAARMKRIDTAIVSTGTSRLLTASGDLRKNFKSIYVK